MLVKNNPAPPVFSAAKPAQVPVTFGHQPAPVTFGKKRGGEEREGAGGLWNLIVRTFNRLVRKGHDNEDERLKKDPVGYLKSQHEQLKAKFQGIEDRLVRVNSLKEQGLEDLQALVETEEKEKREAARAMEFAKTEAANLEAGTSDKSQEFVDALKKAAVNEAQEWKESQARRAAKEETVRGLEDEAAQALAEREDLEEDKARILGEIEQAVELHAATKDKNELVAIRSEIEAIRNNEVTYGESVSGVINEIKLSAKDADFKLSQGKSREERQADLAVRHATKQAEAEAAFAELEAELAGKPAEGAGK